MNCYLVGLIAVACWPQNPYFFFIEYSLFLLKILQSPYLFYGLFRLPFNSSGKKLPTTVKVVKEVSLIGKLKERKTMGLISPNGPNFFWV